MLDSLSEELKTSRAFEDQMRQFANTINNDATLQSKLSEAVDNGISREGFRDLYVETAAAHDLQFSAQQMEIAMQEQKQGKDKVLPTVVQKLITIL